MSKIKFAQNRPNNNITGITIKGYRLQSVKENFSEIICTA